MARASNSFRILRQNPNLFQSVSRISQFSSIAFRSHSAWNQLTPHQFKLTSTSSCLSAGAVHNQPLVRLRWYSSETGGNPAGDNNQSQEKKDKSDPILLMPVTSHVILERRSPFSAIYGWLAYTFGITALDKKFRIDDFLRGASQALEVVSKNLAIRNYEALSEMITEDALAIIKENVDRMTDTERSEIALSRENILRANWHQIKLSEDRNTLPPKRFVEITVKFHVLDARPEEATNISKFV